MPGLITRLLKSNSIEPAILLLAPLFFLLIQPVYSQNEEKNNPPEIAALELEKPIERELAGEEKHSYNVSLSANQYLMVTIEQRGIDVAARIFGADGKQIVNFDAEARPNGTEKIEFAAKTGGVYRLEVARVYKLLPTGKYEIRLKEIRAADEANLALLEDRTLFAESLRLFNAGKYAEAREVIERAIENRTKTVGLENPSTLNALSHLARILNAQGKPDEAIEINRRVLAAKEKILDANHPDIALSLNYIAANYRSKEDFQNAISYYERAIAIWEKALGQLHPTVAANIISLAGIYSELGDREKAIELNERALAILEQTVGVESINVAIVLNNLGSIYVNLKDYKKAESLALRAIAIAEKLYSPENPRVFSMLSTLAIAYERSGELDKAESLYLRVLKGREKTLGADHPLNAYTLNNIASVYALKGDFAKSETFYRRALEIGEKSLGPDNPNVVGVVLSGLSLLLAQKGDVEQAIKMQRRASEIDERNISLNLAIGSERQKLAYIEVLSERTNQNIYLQTRFAPENQDAVELAATTVLRQKGRVMDAVSNNLLTLRQRLDTKDQSLLDNLNALTTELAELILGKPKDATLVEHQAKIKTLINEREKLEDEISRRAAGFYAKSETVTLTAVQSLIPPDSALIEFAVYTPAEADLALKADKKSDEPRYVAYVISNQGKTKWKDIGQTGEINRMIDEFRGALRDPKRKDVKILARALDEKLMQPVRALSGSATHLLISPDGELNLIPFEALVDEQGRYLVERYSFDYLTSGRDLLRMRTARSSKSKSIIFANPNFGAPFAEQSSKVRLTGKTRRGAKGQSIIAARNLTDTYFAPLGGTAQEAISIQTHFPATATLTGALATETALKQTTAPRILHIATHGFFLEDVDQKKSAAGAQAANRSSNATAGSKNPLLRSGLAFAGANQRNDNRSDDGILTALEASGLNLWGTKLVVLSACDTGLGEVKNGEGVYGLRRAFVLAGTESLVMSLWSVSDYVTRELMTNYYKNLKQERGRGAALRRARLEMLKKKGREHPFYWAGFIHSGEWANLNGER